MKEAEIKKLIEKYKAGTSTLSEEQFLFNEAKEMEPSLEAWSTFVKNNQVKAPNDMNNRLWQSFEAKKTSKNRWLVGIMSAAASIILLVSLYLTTLPKQNTMSYSEKEVLLNQALSMVASTDQEETQQGIIYENEIIIIYTTDE